MVDESPERSSARGKRLDSWKEIAVFLGRSVRTVRRWETQERLPVHRHRHASGTSVYAYENELRAWRAHRAERPTPARPEPAPVATTRLRPALAPRLACAAAVAALGVALLWWLVSGRASEAPAAEARALGAAAAELVWSGRPAAAAELFREALAIEPEAAEALAGLGWALHEAGQPLGEVLPLLERARGAARGPGERLLTRAVHDELAGRPEQALATYEALLAIEPGHPWALRRSLELCRSERPAADCLPAAVRLADALPTDLEAAVAAAWLAALTSDDPALSDALEKRAQRLAQEWPAGARAETVARLETLPARRAWADGNPAGALAALEAVEAGLDRWPGPTRDRIAVEAGLVALALGRVSDARLWFHELSDVAEGSELDALALFMGDRMDELRDELAGRSEVRRPFTGVLLTAAGLRAEAAAVAARLAAAADPQARVLAAFAELVDGRPAAAAAELETALPELDPGAPFFFVAWDLMAAAREGEGRVREAVRALERTSPERRLAAFAGTGSMWLRCQGRLAALYRQAERARDAARVESELRRLTSYADASHPLRRRLAGDA